MRYFLFLMIIVSLSAISMQSQGTKRYLPETAPFSECLQKSHRLNALLVVVPISNNDSVKEEIYMNLLIQSLIDKEFEHCKLERFCKGDLNGDSKEDLFVVASRPGGKYETVDAYTTWYRAMIFVSKDVSGYKLAASNDHVIDCSNCEHVRPEISISDDQLIINRYLGSCQREDITETYEYRESDHSWYLKKKEIISLDCNDYTIDGGINTKESTETTDDFGVIRF